MAGQSSNKSDNCLSASHQYQPVLTKQEQWGSTACITPIFVIVMICCFSVGYTSLYSSRNTGAIGTMLSQQTLSFDRCWVNVTFLTTAKDEINSIVEIPCEMNDSGSFIPLCYNRWYPQNVAYDSDHATGQAYMCSHFGYAEARRDVMVGYIFLFLWIGSLFMIWRSDSVFGSPSRSRPAAEVQV